MNPQHSLETVAANFKQWRATRHSKREATPAYLQKQVAELQIHHKAIAIRKALNLSSAALNRWSEAHSSNQASDQATSFGSSFIKLSPEALSVSEPHNDNLILCDFPNGVRLSFNAQSLERSVLSRLFCLTSEVASA